MNEQTNEQTNEQMNEQTNETDKYLFYVPSIDSSPLNFCFKKKME